jgi:hypothetical protein
MILDDLGLKMSPFKCKKQTQIMREGSEHGQHDGQTFQDMKTITSIQIVFPELTYMDLIMEEL